MSSNVLQCPCGGHWIFKKHSKFSKIGYPSSLNLVLFILDKIKNFQSDDRSEMIVQIILAVYVNIEVVNKEKIIHSILAMYLIVLCV